jgi:hypothetical protein
MDINEYLLKKKNDEIKLKKIIIKQNEIIRDLREKIKLMNKLKRINYLMNKVNKN